MITRFGSRAGPLDNPPSTVLRGHGLRRSVRSAPVVWRLIYGSPALAVTGTNPDVAAIDQIRLIANKTAVPIIIRGLWLRVGPSLGNAF